MANKRPPQRKPTQVKEEPVENGEGKRVVTHRSVEWSGPLPPPAVLDGFEQAVPGSSKLIVNEFQAEAEHRRSQERKQGTLTFVDTLIGRLTALAFAGGGFYVTHQAIIHSESWVGSIVGGGMIVSGMAVLIRGRK